MSISGISSSSLGIYQPSSRQQGIRSDFKQLAQSLQSGDLTGAQAAYASIVQIQGTQSGGSRNTSSSPFAQMLSQVGSALQSGNLSGAQSALASWQQLAQTQGAGGHHHHHHAQAASGGGQSGNLLASLFGTSSPPDADGDSSGGSGTGGATASAGNGVSGLLANIENILSQIQSGGGGTAQPSVNISA
ncbi:MAG: hypothetical protein KGI29_01760 [Pseudomonadota bacterium]|nr:hypothetical protein [Pseudomonadota bacterium]MDE3037640.1 hypothetical protein [Pseudomonadota bacterium]